jgi:nitrite reductase (NADH) small subunit
MMSNNNTNWITVCSDSDLVNNSGVCALLEDQQIALFKVQDADQQKLYAISNWDPIGKANVLYRGLIGSVDKSTVVISPLYKQRYCLESGQCLDDQHNQLRVYPVRVEQQKIQVLWAN